MSTSVIIAFIGVVGTISGILLGWKGALRTARNDTKEEVKEETTLKTDVEYIKRAVDEMRNDFRSQRKDYDGLTERVTRLEEKAGQANARLKRLEGIA